MNRKNICPNKKCFGHSGNGHGSYLKVWKEYTASDGYRVHDTEDGFRIGSSKIDYGNVKTPTGVISVWCMWCNTRIPDKNIPQSIKDAV